MEKLITPDDVIKHVPALKLAEQSAVNAYVKMLADAGEPAVRAAARKYWGEPSIDNAVLVILEAAHEVADRHKTATFPEMNYRVAAFDWLAGAEEFLTTTWRASHVGENDALEVLESTAWIRASANSLVLK